LPNIISKWQRNALSAISDLDSISNTLVVLPYERPHPVDAGVWTRPEKPPPLHLLPICRLSFTLIASCHVAREVKVCKPCLSGKRKGTLTGDIRGGIPLRSRLRNVQRTSDAEDLRAVCMSSDNTLLSNGTVVQHFTFSLLLSDQPMPGMWSLLLLLLPEPFTATSQSHPSAVSDSAWFGWLPTGTWQADW